MPVMIVMPVVAVAVPAMVIMVVIDNNTPAAHEPDSQQGGNQQ